jgi:hypothetical protein
LSITTLVAPPLLFPPLKFQKKWLILGANDKRTPRGMKARSVLFYLKISRGQCSSSDYFAN